MGHQDDTTTAQIPTSPITVKVPIAPHDQEPQIEVVREGEVITVIRVSCPCGRTVDLHCDYTKSAE